MGTAGHHGHVHRAAPGKYNKPEKPQRELNVKNVTQRGNSGSNQVWKHPKCVKRQKDEFKTHFALPS